MYCIQAIFDLFHDEVGARDPEGLAAMKVILNCKQINPKEIRKNYYAADLFLDKALDSILLEAGCERFGVEATAQEADLEPTEGK